MPETLPIVLVPGLLCSARLYGLQIPQLWQIAPVMVADHRRDDTIAAIAARILADAPPCFALAGLSMGGYIAAVVAQQAPERVRKLALLDTSARPETARQTERRLEQIALAESGRLVEVADLLFPLFVHRDHQGDDALKRIIHVMAEEIGAEAFVRQQRAIMTRPDLRPHLASIRCPTLVLVGDGDELTPPPLSEEIAAGIPGSRLVVVPDCGHLSTLEQPEAVNEALVEWLEPKGG
jgi:pimeloyl-ACP methyl ester carboxylesterase